MGQVQGWAKAHLYINLDPTCGQRSKDGKWTDPSFEEPEEQMHLELASLDHLHQKTEHRGKH